MPLPITDPKFGDMESIKSVLTEEENRNFHPKPSGLKKGQASFHHPLMVHGSFANRYGMGFVYQYGTELYESDNELAVSVAFQ